MLLYNCLRMDTHVYKLEKVRVWVKFAELRVFFSSSFSWDGGYEMKCGDLYLKDFPDRA